MVLLSALGANKNKKKKKTYIVGAAEVGADGLAECPWCKKNKKKKKTTLT